MVSAGLGGSWAKQLRNPPKYLTASLIVSVAGLLNGLDTGVIGPVTAMPSFAVSFGELQSTLRGIVVSCMLLSATFSSLFAGVLSDRFGRPRAIAIGALTFAVGASIEAGASSMGMFIAGRCIVGVGQGFFLSTLVVYICEISPPKHRGVLASIVQVLITVGLTAGYFMCYGTIKLDSSLSWRLPIAVQAGIALFVALSSYFYLPQSPRWLAFKGRGNEAIAIWDKLGVSNAEREKDLEQRLLVNSPPEDTAGTPKTGLVEWVRQSTASSLVMFGKSNRKQMFLGVFMMSMQQLSGIDGVLYYAPLLFQQAGMASSQASFLASGISAILICVCTILAFMLVDKWGRRASTLYGGLLLFSCMLLIGSLYASNSVHADYGIGRWVVIITIYIFAVTYAMTWALGVKLFASEIQPIATRATATSLAQSANCITNFFVAFITPILLASSSFGIYFLFGTCTLLTVFVCAAFMPETRGQALESIGESFLRHSAGDVAVVRGLRGLVSWLSRMGRSRENRQTRSSEVLGARISRGEGTDTDLRLELETAVPSREGSTSMTISDGIELVPLSMIAPA